MLFDTSRFVHALPRKDSHPSVYIRGAMRPDLKSDETRGHFVGSLASASESVDFHRQ